MLHTSARVCSIQNDISREHVRFLTCLGSLRMWGPFLGIPFSADPRPSPLDPDLRPSFQGKVLFWYACTRNSVFSLIRLYSGRVAPVTARSVRQLVSGCEHRCGGDFALLAQGKGPPRHSFEHMSVGSARFNKNGCSSTGVLHYGALVHRFNREKGYPQGVYL